MLKTVEESGVKQYGKQEKMVAKDKWEGNRRTEGYMGALKRVKHTITHS